MPSSSTELRRHVGSLLVFLQFGLLALMAVRAAPLWTQGTLPVASIWLGGASALLGGWTLLHNRLGNFNIHPAPKPGGALVTAGPYRWVRHPMYSAVLLAAAAMTWALPTWLAWGSWLALAAVLVAKATLEERWLSQHHVAYARYCTQSKRFIPWVL